MQIQYRKTFLPFIAMSAAASLILSGCGSGKNNERIWSVYKADSHSSNYSPLDQINVSNVSKLNHAWTFSIQDKPAGSQPGHSQCNPIIIDGVLYATSSSQWAYAMDAASGKQFWSFDPYSGTADWGDN